MRKRVDDEVDRHLKADRGGFAQIPPARPFPAVADVLVVTNHNHHPPGVVEDTVVDVVDAGQMMKLIAI